MVLKGLLACLHLDNKYIRQHIFQFALDNYTIIDLKNQLPCLLKYHLGKDQKVSQYLLSLITSLRTDNLLTEELIHSLAKKLNNT